VIPSLLALLAIALGVVLFIRSMQGRNPGGALPTSGKPLWLGVGLALLLIALLTAASAGRALIFLLPAVLALPLLFRRGSKPRNQPPAQVIETDWFRAFKEQTSSPMDAIVLRGSMQDRRLSELGLADLVWLHQQIDDDGSLGLLERFLTQEFPGWRERVEKAAADLLADGMTAAKAREILGLGPEAGPDEIVDAHRRLMQRLHPDRGGSGYLATLLNRAKTVLLEQR
jgi:hypothetical protein